MENQSQPSFYAVIPANVRYCKDIEPNAKLLYGEITALCSKEGYCWASNDYFADLYQVDERTIKRWIESLKKLKFVFVDIDRSNFKTPRKIWISSEVKNMFTKGQKCPEGGTKMSRGGDKNVPHINTDIITSINTEEKERGDASASSPPPPAPSFFQKGNIKIRGDKLKELVEKYGETLINEYIERLEDYSETNQKKFKQYSCHAAVIRTWLKRDGCRKIHQDKNPHTSLPPKAVATQKDGKINSDFKWIDSFLEKNRNLQRNGLVEMYDKFISFPSVPEAKFYYGEMAFREKVKNSFRKLDVHGID